MSSEMTGNELGTGDENRGAVSPVSVQPTPSTGHPVTRLEALSDGVFAFAVTLLVVSLEMPKSFAELQANAYGFVAFGLCFGMMIYIWWEHNVFFRRYGLEDGVTAIINSVLLFVVLFYVYPLKYVFTTFVAAFFGIAANVRMRFEDLPALFILYAAGLIAVFLSLALLYVRVLMKRDGVQRSASDVLEIHFAIRHHLIFVFVGVISIVIAWGGWGIQFGAPGWAFGLLAPLCALNGMYLGHQLRKAEQKSDSGILY